MKCKDRKRVTVLDILAGSECVHTISLNNLSAQLEFTLREDDKGLDSESYTFSAATRKRCFCTIRKIFSAPFQVFELFQVSVFFILHNGTLRSFLQLRFSRVS